MRIENIKKYAIDPDAKCSICGETPTAVWSGQVFIYSCSHCAVTVLPKLIADASYPRAAPVTYAAVMERIRKTFCEISASFWKGVASAAIFSERDLRKKYDIPHLALFESEPLPEEYFQEGER